MLLQRRPPRGEGGEIGGHARLDVADVGFRNLCPDGHRRQPGDAQDQRRLLLGVERLAFPGADGDHGAAHRRINARVTQLGFIAAQVGLGLADLCLEHVYAGLGRAHLGLGGLHVFFAGGAAGLELLLATEFLLRQVVLGALFLKLGLEVFDGKPSGVEPGFLCGRVDFNQQLALRDLVAGLDVNLLDLPGRLGAHVDVAPRLQGA